MRRQQGFTLIEMVVVITVMGILAYGSVQFILNTSGAYADSQARQRLGLLAASTFEQLSRELQQALPGSLRVSEADQGECLEFIPINNDPQQQTANQRRLPPNLTAEDYYRPAELAQPGNGYSHTTPVSFCITEQNLYRYQSYLSTEQQPSLNQLPQKVSSGRVMLADHVDSPVSAFQIIKNQQGQQQWVLLTLDFHENDEHLLFQQEVRLVY